MAASEKREIVDGNLLTLITENWADISTLGRLGLHWAIAPADISTLGTT